MKTLIIGGGLSGLALADRMEAGGLDYHMLEARSRFGGRIDTQSLQDGHAFDMGPAWFWPGQARIAALIDRFGLKQFEQYADGDLLFEDETGRVTRGMGFASMQGSWRLQGGLGALVDALADGIPAHRKQLSAQVVKLAMTQAGCTATLSSGSVLRADRIVLAMPPRLMAQIDYAPALTTQTIKTMQGVSTWMAGQAKAVAVYHTPFWRNAGLSGDAMSRHGPMVEIHDASPHGLGSAALFGFIGVPPKARVDEPLLRQAVHAQFVRLFGPDAATPEQLFIKDWAQDPFTATEADTVPSQGHPSYGLPRALQNLWDGHLVLAGTEVAQDFGGYIEGALEAADAAWHQLATAPFVQPQVRPAGPE